MAFFDFFKNKSIQSNNKSGYTNINLTKGVSISTSGDVFMNKDGSMSTNGTVTINGKPYADAIKNSGKIVKKNIDISGVIKEVRIFSVVELELNVSATQTQQVVLEIDENLVPHFECVLEDKILFAGFKNNVNIQGGAKLIVTVPDLSKLELSGACQVKGNYEAEELKVDCSGASSVRLEGFTQALDIDCSGASQVHLKHLESRSVEVHASGASSVSVWAKKVRINASGASHVDVFGLDVDVVKERSSGAASIKIKNRLP